MILQWPEDAPSLVYRSADGPVVLVRSWSTGPGTGAWRERVVGGVHFDSQEDRPTTSITWANGGARYTLISSARLDRLIPLAVCAARSTRSSVVQ